MAPMPAKTLRLSELDEKDRTAYFSVTALMERRKAIAARSEPPPETAPPPRTAEPAGDGLVPTPPTRPGFIQQLRAASPARKGILVVLPLLIGLMALRPTLEESRMESVETAPNAPAPVAAPTVQPVPVIAPTPPGPPPSVSKGVTRERAASDALAAGDFERALGLYRELSVQDPDNAAYREASRILERRLRQRQP